MKKESERTARKYFWLCLYLRHEFQWLQPLRNGSVSHHDNVRRLLYARSARFIYGTINSHESFNDSHWAQPFAKQRCKVAMFHLVTCMNSESYFFPHYPNIIIYVTHSIRETKFRSSSFTFFIA